ncbi:GntR family transcriptional regulator [Curtobacterium citreum]
MQILDGTSKYAAVRQHLLERILAMQDGEKLPPEPALCVEYDVSRATIRRAVEGLIADGRLIRKQGLGTFVTEPQFGTHYRERFADSVKGFFVQQTEEGLAVTSRVIGQQIRHADDVTAVQLGLPVGDTVVELVRLRYVNNTLHHHVVTYLPEARFPATATYDFSDGSLFEYLRTEYRTTLTRNDLLVRVAPAPPDIAGALNVEPGERLLQVASTVFDTDEVAAAYGVSHFTPSNSELFFGLHN